MVASSWAGHVGPKGVAVVRRCPWPPMGTCWQECVGQTAELTCVYEAGIVLSQPKPGREGCIVPF